MTVSLRPKYGARLALTVGGAAVAALIVVLATSSRAASIEGHLVAVAIPERPVDPAWTIASEPIQRTGYRHGRPHVIEVVPLGPTAVEVEVRTALAFLAMRTAAADAGADLRLESGFRTVEKQRALYWAWRKGRGNQAARPGRSNHQSGRALDINVVSDPVALAWLEANAATFGFKRTVKNEPWHWEYVEVETARAKPVARKTKPGKATKVRHVKRPARRSTSGKRVAGSPR